MDGPPITSSDDRAKSWLVFAVGIVATIAAVVGLVRLWPDDEGDERTLAVEVPTTGAVGEPSDRPGQELASTTAPTVSIDLFEAGAADAVGEIATAAGSPTQVLEVAIYDSYAFLAYRDPAQPGNIDRRMWRDGAVGVAEPNPIDDRVDADTEPGLFGLDEVDLSIVPALVQDAATRYDRPVDVTHILIDRFLPFDERVLIRVYAAPSDGRSGGGYVSYDTAGTLVRVCC